MGIEYIGGDKHTDVYIFNVEENRTDEIISKLENMDFVEYASIYDDKLRKLWDIRYEMNWKLEYICGIAEKKEFIKSDWDKKYQN